MPDQTPLLRQWLLMQMLARRHFGATVKELAHELSVSEKTIRRDLERLQYSGIPLRKIEEAYGRISWKLDRPEGAPPVSFTFDEAAALHLARRFMEPLAGTYLWQAAQRAFQKLRALFGTDTLRYLEKFAAFFHQTQFGAVDYSQQAELIDKLMIGAEERRAVRIRYQSLKATEPVSYEVHPYGLTYHRGALYLVGMAPRHKQIRHWKVRRIAAAELSDRTFRMPPDFDIHQHFAKSFGVFHGDGDVAVRIRFAAPVARYVSEAQWHESQKLTRQRDGSLIAEFQLDGYEEIKRWILSFGRFAQVLEPEALRNELAEELQQMNALYSPTGEQAVGQKTPARSRSGLLAEMN